MCSHFDSCALPCSYFSISCNVIYQHAKRTDWLSRCAGNTTISIITYRKNYPCKNQFTPLTNALVKRLRQTLRAAWSGCVSAQLNGQMIHYSSQLVHKLISLYAACLVFFCMCITKVINELTMSILVIELHEMK